MNIYLAHSSAYNFQQELYQPLQASSLVAQHTFIFPHLEQPGHSKELIKTSDLVIAEVSYPSTGLGVELGWADQYGVKIVCLHKQDTKPSSALNFISNDFFTYSSSEELIAIISKILI